MRPPPERPLELGSYKAVYRAWGAGEVCGADPARLTGELRSVNTLLAEFLGATSGGREGHWTEEQLSLLGSAAKLLPPALDAHEAVVGTAPHCQFPRDSGVAEEAVRGEELARQARNRLAEGPELLEFIRARQALEKWKEGQPAAAQRAREQRCPPKLKPGSVDLYFAWEDERGKTEWLFCDGSRVVAVPGKSPELVPSEEPKAKAKARKVAPKGYLDAATGYPGGEVQRAPKLPARKVPPPKASDLGPEPTDEF